MNRVERRAAEKKRKRDIKTGKGGPMSTAGIKVLFIGKSWDVPYNVQLCTEPTAILGHIAKFLPDVIITSLYTPGNLRLSSFELRKRWMHVSESATNEEIINVVEGCYAFNIWSRSPYQDDNPLVTVYTGTYNTGDVLRDTYQSLRDQTYPTWEWCVVDDESTDDTFDKLMAISREDHRVRPMRIKHNGKIGGVKDTATRMAYGEYLVELDHDDMLTDNALAEIVQAFKDPDVGMVYTNCANFFADGSPHQFNDAFWAPRYRDTEYRGKVYKECINPSIYDRCGPWHQHQFAYALLYGPNHARCYRASLLRQFGGYNKELPIADDLDVFMRFFLNSTPPEVGQGKGMMRCVHLNKMLYLYRFHDGYTNTTFTRNKSIQDHVALCQRNYDTQFQDMNVRRERAMQSRVAQKQEPTAEPGVVGNQGWENLWSFVVLDWNTQNVTEMCLRSIREACPSAEIILVENGRHFDCDLANTVIKLETNIGFSAGCNRGAMAAHGKYICFLNSDAMVSAKNVETFQKVLDQGAGAVGPYSNQAKPPQGNHPNGYSYGSDLEMEMISAFCIAMKRNTFNQVGGFDCQLCNFEDDDISRRIRLLGYKLVLADTWVMHQEHTSFRANKLDVNVKIEESRKLYHTKWPEIKVVAITLNEMKALPGFFEQFRGITKHFAILDSGSTDGTVEWAEKNGVEVFKRPFDNFADQRNAALESIGKDGGWVIMHDPDERLDPITLANIHILANRNDYDIFLLPLDALNYDGTRTNWVAKPFMFRNMPEVKWVNPVHEKLIGSMRQAMIRNGMNTHILELHDPNRRASMQEMYAKLGGDASLDPKWPILNYNHRDDDRIDKVYVGPLVSVVTPTYNRPELLKRAVDSIKAQDYLSTEIIVVGDKDPVFQELSGCRCLNLPVNHGAGGAEPRNYGIMMSSAPLVAYLDDDNAWKKNHLSSLVLKLLETGAEYAFSSIDLNGKGWKCDEPKRGKIDTSCLLHKKELISRFGWWKDRQAATYAHDWEFVKPWTVANVKWTATIMPTVIYNIETSGQAEFLNNLVKGIK